MKIKTVLIIPALLCLMANSASAIQPAMLNAAGALIDEKGRVTAIPNRKDSRNSQTERYYVPVDENGRPQQSSQFLLTKNPRNPLGGFVSYDLAKKESPANPNGPEAPQPEVAPEAEENNNQNQPATTGQVGGGANTSYNNPDINQPRYNQNYTPEVLYK